MRQPVTNKYKLFLIKELKRFCILNMLGKTIEGYLDSVPSLTFNTIKTKLIMHAFRSSRYLQLKWMFDLSHASMKSTMQVQMVQPSIQKVTNIQNMIETQYYCLYSLMTGWKNYCWLSVKTMARNFVIAASFLLLICCHIGWGMPYLHFCWGSYHVIRCITDNWVWTLVCCRHKNVSNDQVKDATK